jgi:hypothetical protein
MKNIIYILGIIYFSFLIISCGNKTDSKTVEFSLKDCKKELKAVKDSLFKFKKESKQLNLLINDIVKSSKIDNSNYFLDTTFEVFDNKVITYKHSTFYNKFEKTSYLIIVVVNQKNELLSYKKIQLNELIIADGGSTWYNSSVLYVDNSIVIRQERTNHNEWLFPTTYHETIKELEFNILKDKIESLPIKEISDTSYISGSDLKKLHNLSLEELRRNRNSFFAKYNYKFKDSILIEYFEKNFNCYSPDYDNVDDKLTNLDKQIIEYIKNVEKEK